MKLNLNQPGPRTSVLAAAIVAALGGGEVKAGDVTLTHDGDHRCFDVSNDDRGSIIIESHGNGGCATVDVRGGGSADVFVLGDGITIDIKMTDHSGSIFQGMCPSGTRPAPLRDPHTGRIQTVPGCI